MPWEYKVLPLTEEAIKRSRETRRNAATNDELEEVLNDYGGVGWELVAFFDLEKELNPSRF